MRELTYAEALREGLRQAMTADSRVFMIGEDIGVYGGAFGVSAGLRTPGDEFDAFLEKPIDIARLLDVIDRLVLRGVEGLAAGRDAGHTLAFQRLPLLG